MTVCHPRDLLGETGALIRSLMAAGKAGATAVSATDPRGSVTDADLSALGITRVGELTDLDTIGIPVYFACRPNSRSLSVCQGKALQPSDARLGAIMEAIEQSFAERGEDLIALSATAEAMAQRGLRYVDRSTMLRMPLDETVGAVHPWVAGISAVDGNEVYAPYQLVGLDLRSEANRNGVHSPMSSVGLAAGLSLPDAILHATLEVVENDATALLDIFGVQQGLVRTVTLDGASDGALLDAVARVEAAGAACSFFDITGQVALPTIAAFIAPRERQRASFGAETFAGFACRLTPERAALSALLEAVQSRLTVISGARDDLTLDDYRGQPVELPPRGDGVLPLWALPRPPVEPDAPSETKLRWVLHALIEAGSEPVVVPLGGTKSGVRAVRVLVSSLQSAATNGVMRISDAALEALLSPRPVRR